MGVSLVLQSFKKKKRKTICHHFSETTELVAMGMLQGAPHPPTNGLQRFVTAGNLACCLGDQRLCTPARMKSCVSAAWLLLKMKHYMVQKKKVYRDIWFYWYTGSILIS